MGYTILVMILNRNNHTDPQEGHKDMPIFSTRLELIQTFMTGIGIHHVLFGRLLSFTRQLISTLKNCIDKLPAKILHLPLHDVYHVSILCLILAQYIKNIKLRLGRHFPHYGHELM